MVGFHSIEKEHPPIPMRIRGCSNIRVRTWLQSLKIVLVIWFLFQPQEEIHAYAKQIGDFYEYRIRGTCAARFIRTVGCQGDAQGIGDCPADDAASPAQEF